SRTWPRPVSPIGRLWPKALERPSSCRRSTRLAGDGRESRAGKRVLGWAWEPECAPGTGNRKRRPEHTLFSCNLEINRPILLTAQTDVRTMSSMDAGVWGVAPRAGQAIAAELIRRRLEID